jgi:type IV secretory pathway TrbD component
MAMTPRVQPVYASINRALTIGGADRRLFFAAVVIGGGTFTFFGSLLAGAVMFVTLFTAARFVAQRDPQLIQIVLRSATARPIYDPAKLARITVVRSRQR